MRRQWMECGVWSVEKVVKSIPQISCSKNRLGGKCILSSFPQITAIDILFRHHFSGGAQHQTKNKAFLCEYISEKVFY